MLRSMYAGISGMKNFQTKLDVVGNNIANVNTSGFKKGRITFQDMMSQTVSGAQGPTDNRGGINPKQVGLGSQLGSIDNVHTQGFRQTTNRPLDFAIEGDGMFVVASGDLPPNGVANVYEEDDISLYYTRAGNFYLDEDRSIVNAGGLHLIGFQANDANEGLTNQQGKLTLPENFKSFSVEQDGRVTYIDANGDPKIAGQVSLAKFSNAAGLEKLGGSLYVNSNNAGRSNTVETPEEQGMGSIVSSSLEMSNVDLAEEFTEMITAQRGFQANTRIITTSDEILQELVNLKR